jgi:hypothetical protein
LTKNACVGENQAEGGVLSVQISPTEKKNRKNERKAKCEYEKNRRQEEKNPKTNGKRNVKIKKITDKRRKIQKRTEF